MTPLWSQRRRKYKAVLLYSYRKLKRNSKRVSSHTKLKTTQERDEYIVVNWVQCDECKSWRILPDDIDTTTLPARW